MNISEDSIRAQLLEAYIAKDDAETKIRGLRNLLAGVQVGRAVAAKESADATESPGAQASGDPE